MGTPTQSKPEASRPPAGGAVSGSKTLTCPATVRQVGDTFQRGNCNHLHPARDAQTAIQEVEPRRRWLLPKFPTMFRAVNRYRATYHHPEPVMPPTATVS
ncbi:hypothetical protein FSP39_006031 [Pinctada imbricata]|uniref:Uncharacterized protein n=1 Tax=Pinctada imbricata TaxID=66713 RepID=A0AA88Y7U4_PINIB|nr:hypothetical protein FSP39_006031 [Pinctada imbricata]